MYLIGKMAKQHKTFAMFLLLHANYQTICLLSIPALCFSNCYMKIIHFGGILKKYELENKVE